MSKKKKNNGPKVLVFDIETAPMLAHVWGLFDQNVALNQIDKDWHVLSWSAKWYENENGDLFGPHNKVMYMDQRNKKKLEDDSILLKGIWKLLNEADVVITQNGRRFDVKKLNARFLLNGMQPPSSYKHIDTLVIAKNKFALTSNKLEFMTGQLCTKYKKLKSKKFQGFTLWKECLANNLEAWNEMEKYNKYDVLSLEELAQILIPWDASVNFNLYTENSTHVCTCGSEDFKKNGFSYTSVGRFQRWACTDCGKEVRDRTNLFNKEKKKSIKVKVT